jgi:AhpD family alkylhydroperoxidase
MKNLLTSLPLTVLLAAAPIQVASAQSVPPFVKKLYPKEAQSLGWQEDQAISDPEGALDAKTKQLIGLAVAAQIPCQYCVYFHTKAAENAGATDAQIKEAIATAALTRKWSTVLNGSAYDFDTFKQETDGMFASN